MQNNLHLYTKSVFSECLITWESLHLNLAVHMYLFTLENEVGNNWVANSVHECCYAKEETTA